MRLVNHTGLEAGWTLGFERDGRELLIVAVKATYEIPPNGEEPQLSKEQLKLTKSDEFTGEPGFSAPLHETDYSHRKLKCDVILNGSAHAPGGIPARRVEVSLSVSEMNKSFYVFGERRWEDVLLSTSDPEPFVQTPISHGFAYGGADFNEDAPERVETYVQNPIGVGYHPVRRRSALVGKLLQHVGTQKPNFRYQRQAQANGVRSRGPKFFSTLQARRNIRSEVD